MTAEMLLDLVQEFLGEPVGGFYNISQRLALLSQVQNEMVAETGAIQCTATILVEGGNPIVPTPSGFARLGNLRPVFNDTTLRVVPPLELDLLKPEWQTEDTNAVPEYITMRGSDMILSPTPALNGTLIITYVPVLAPFSEMEDTAFNGYPNIERFAIGIAYKVAAIIATPRNPTVAQMYADMYVQEERKMRHATRSNPQKGQRIFPAAGRGYYAAGS